MFTRCSVDIQCNLTHMISMTQPDFLGEAQSRLGGGVSFELLYPLVGSCDLLCSKLFIAVGMATLEACGSIMIQFFLRAIQSP